MLQVKIHASSARLHRVDLKLGDSTAHQCPYRGATCDLIPDHLPGVGYVQLDGVAEPVRVRFSHVTDDHILHSGQPVEILTVTGPVLALADHEETAA